MKPIFNIFYIALLIITIGVVYGTVWITKPDNANKIITMMFTALSNAVSDFFIRAFNAMLDLGDKYGEIILVSIGGTIVYIIEVLWSFIINNFGDLFFNFWLDIVNVLLAFFDQMFTKTGEYISDAITKLLRATLDAINIL
jgi:hypothetical protein